MSGQATFVPSFLRRFGALGERPIGLAAGLFSAAIESANEAHPLILQEATFSPP